MAKGEFVSVVIPAYNAEATLATTVWSACAQTYANLDIIVVDDGSTDGTLTLAHSLAQQDPRIRVLTKPNSGVAETRNFGIRTSSSSFVAPLDADDIWHPEKIAKQMAVMAAGGPQMGFVYTGYRRIDAEGRAFYTPSPRLFQSGRVFHRHIITNFVGNGSAPLIRREAFDAVGGYETDPGVQGAEDHLLQILIARAWTVGVVPEYLVGYRQTGGSVSSGREGMDRAKLRLLEHVRARCPGTAEDALAVAEAYIRSRRAVLRLLGERRPLDAAAEFWRSLRCAPVAALRFGGAAARSHLHGILRRRLRRAPSRAGAPFLALDPTDASGAETASPPLLAWLRAFQTREDVFFPSRLDGAPAAARAGAVPVWQTESQAPALSS